MERRVCNESAFSCYHEHVVVERAAAAAAFQQGVFSVSYFFLVVVFLFFYLFFLSSPSFPVARANVRRVAALHPTPHSSPPEPACVCCKFNPRRRDSSFLSGMLLVVFFFAPCFPISSCLMSAIIQQSTAAGCLFSLFPSSDWS